MRWQPVSDGTCARFSARYTDKVAAAAITIRTRERKASATENKREWTNVQKKRAEKRPCARYVNGALDNDESGNENRYSEYCLAITWIGEAAAFESRCATNRIRTEIPNISVELSACLHYDNHSVCRKSGRCTREGLPPRQYNIGVYVTLWSLSTHSFKRIARFSTNAHIYFFFLTWKITIFPLSEGSSGSETNRRFITNCMENDFDINVSPYANKS